MHIAFTLASFKFILIMSIGMHSYFTNHTVLTTSAMILERTKSYPSGTLHNLA